MKRISEIIEGMRSLGRLPMPPREAKPRTLADVDALGVLYLSGIAARVIECSDLEEDEKDAQFAAILEAFGLKNEDDSVDPDANVCDCAAAVLDTVAERR